MRLFIILLCIHLFSSCEKSRTEFSGEVSNPITGEKYSGVEFTIWQYDTDTYMNSEQIGSVVTDQNGRFHFSTVHKRNKTITLDLIDNLTPQGLYILGHVNHNGDMYIGSSFGGNLEIGGTYVANYSVVRKGYVNLSLANINCFDQNDRASITVSYYLSPFNIESTYLTKNGCGSDTELIALPEGEHYVMTEVRKNMITTVEYDTIVVPPGDTLDFNYDY